MPTFPRTSSRPVRAFALTLLLVFAGGLSADALAQAPDNQARSLTGVVQDVRGLPLLGAFVAAIALGADQPAAVVVTNARGEFEIGGLSNGVYSLLVGSLGFAGTVVQGVNVPVTSPVTLQLEQEGQRRLLTSEAPLELNWALRSKERDVLRQGETLIAEGDDTTPVSFNPIGEPVLDVTPALAGELRLWSFTNVGDSQTFGITSLSLGSSDTWNIKAHVGAGSVWASSDVRHEIDGHNLRVGFGYVGGDFDLLRPSDSEITDSWIGRLEVSDSWQASDPLSVSYGMRYEHQNSLADSSLLSPRVEVAYEPIADTRVVTGVALNTRGLDLANDNGFEVMSVLNKSNLRVADTSDVVPERALRYHLGVERQIGDAAVRVQAYYDDVTDELLGVYVAGADGLSNYLLFNMGDARARGFEFAVAADFLRSLSGEVTYQFRDRDEPYRLSVPDGLLTSGEEIADSTLRQTHEVKASVAAELPTSRTLLQASYNWRTGLPVIQDGQVRSDFGRFDLRVRQPLPFRTMSTEWSAMVQIRNLLGPEYDGLYNISLAELVGLTRGIAGGLAVRF